MFKEAKLLKSQQKHILIYLRAVEYEDREEKMYFWESQKILV